MSAVAVIAGALARAEVHRLPPPARAYLAGRLRNQIARGDIDPERNLGGLRDTSFGAANHNAGEASFPSADAAAKALVAVCFRAAPRDWGKTSAAELAMLSRYPFNAERQRQRLAELAGAPPELGWWPGFGPSDEAEATFRGLMADHAAFDRLGVGDRIFGPNDPDKSRPNLADEVKAWRTFRDEWLAADIPSSEIGGRLTAAVIGANRIRQHLADARIVDPALKTELRKGVDVDQATSVAKPAAKVETWAKSVPVLSWLTDPSQPPAQASRRILITAGVGATVLAGLAFLADRRRKAVPDEPEPA